MNSPDPDKTPEDPAVPPPAVPPPEAPPSEVPEASCSESVPSDPALSEPEFETLLERFAEGDESALVELIEKEGPGIQRRLEARIPAGLRRRVGASDIVQHTMVDLMGLQDRFDNRGLPAFRKLLRNMADLSLAQAIRRERAKKRDIIRECAPPPGFALESGISDPVDRVPADQTSPSGVLSREESAEAMRSAFSQLDSADQEIIRWIDYEDIGYSEAAERLGLNLKAVQKRHSRAIGRLREQIRRAEN